MDAKEKVISGFMCFGLSRHGADTLFADVIEAVKGECCSGSQQWEIAADFEVRVAEPQLIQGYTAEQWQEIKKGGYLCQFSEDGETWTRGARCLGDTDYSTSLTFAEGRAGTTMWWKYCRPAQIKGVMRPTFVEPVDKSSMLCLFDRGGFPLNNRMSRPSWYGYKDGSGDFYAGAIKYIEL